MECIETPFNMLDRTLDMDIHLSISTRVYPPNTNSHSCYYYLKQNPVQPQIKYIEFAEACDRDGRSTRQPEEVSSGGSQSEMTRVKNNLLFSCLCCVALLLMQKQKVSQKF